MWWLGGKVYADYAKYNKNIKVKISYLVSLTCTLRTYVRKILNKI